MPNRRYPMQPYPTSWYRVADAAEVTEGAIHRVHYFGRDMILWRDKEGTAHAADAYCPHMGANLGVGGRIEDDTVVCPFHTWRFTADGACVHIPYSDKIPSQARLRTFPVQEVNGVVAVFYDERGERPAWTVPELDSMGPGQDWIGPRVRGWKVRTHVQEIFDNAADSAHQKTLHAALEYVTASAEFDGPYYRGEFHGTYDAGEGLPEAQAYARNRSLQAGLGFSLMRSTIDYAGYQVERSVMLSVTPIDEEHVHYLSYQYTLDAGDELTPAVHEMISDQWEKALLEDIPIFENKVFRSLPSRARYNGGEAPAFLCEGEGDIARLRNWARQFYTEEQCAV
ncbi:Rieske 2Fe-2S domain-containing protein [Bailinhaonella thermotolerans]|uniref:cholesterol 7-desaturase n=1 Tax=Bailinhaonella thermotolerans TaxID=1070861 RepID=A0A3A4BAH1_9ACTN|nr:Rieske 2Fe-2S domain-containing protein [Bailinhaonella thermotolerans]RJL35919.1 hypothetical protein D5H75_03890 [Bailinhaonella thermotolerans]